MELLLKQKNSKKIITSINSLKKDGLRAGRLFLYLCQNNTLMFKIYKQSYLAEFQQTANESGQSQKWQMAIIGYRYYVTTRALR
jgi:hypothetical protein